MTDTNQLPEPDLGYIKTDKSNQPAFSARQMREMKDTNQLPPLPEPEGVIVVGTQALRGFTADQMRAYALQARAQVQGEPMAWLHWLNGPVRVFMNKDVAMMELDHLNREYPLDADDRKMRPLVFGDTAQQPIQVQGEVCPTCGETEPYTGSCGTSNNDTKALCKKPAQAAQAEAQQPATGDDFDLICNAIDKADTITMEGDYMLDSDDCIAVVRVMQVLLSVRAAAPAQLSEA